jgi:pyruvate dehydrogenase E1 component alpha subunit
LGDHARIRSNLQQAQEIAMPETSASAPGPALEPALRRDLYRRMLLVRAFEETITELSREQGRLPGMQILATGQEAAAVGVVAAMQEHDVLVTNHRSHGHLLARGADPGGLMAEIMGKAHGVNKGKSGTLHLAVPEIGAPMTSTVVGASPPLALGAAFAQQYRGEPGVTVAFFGDGAAAEGSVHEAMNLAAVWKLPLLFVCENNCWAGAQRLEVHCSACAIARRGEAYGIPGECVDGNDVETVLDMAGRLLRHCRTGSGPALLELRTYRMRGHGEYDRQLYVDKDELEHWASRCPVSCYGRTLTEQGLLSPQDLEAMDREARERVDAPEAAMDDLWVEDPWTGAPWRQTPQGDA